MKALGSLLSINQLTTEQIERILALARRMDPDRPSQVLRGKRVVLLFYEASTRTRASFEFAAKSLGAMTTLVTATLLTGPDRTAAWTTMHEFWPPFRKYADTSGRELRIFRLTPTG